MKRTFRRLVMVLVHCFFSPFFPVAQVTLLPTTVFLSENPGIGSVDVRNDTGIRQEVSIGFEFAYLGNDRKGNLKMIDDDAEMETRFSIDRQIRAFPRTFMLSPGSRQTVRIQVRPSGGRPDGVYWTRAIVTSRVAAEDPGRLNVNEKLGTRIQYVFKQNIPVFYRKGDVTTGLEITGVKTEVSGTGIKVQARLRPTGNAPFNGSADAILRNSSGQVVASQHSTTVIYAESLRLLELPFSDVIMDRGNYTLELRYQTKRRDISPSDLVQAPPVSRTVYLRIE